MGNICQLNIFGADLNNSSSLNGIGLPAPKSNYVCAVVTNGTYVTGKAEYVNGTWSFSKITNGANYTTGYGSCAYITQ